MGEKKFGCQVVILALPVRDISGGVRRAVRWTGLEVRGVDTARGVI